MGKYGILLLGLICKLAILAIYGPFSSGETGGYTRVAAAILSDPTFFSKVPDWSTSALPLFAFRPIGYPLVIALADSLAGSDSTYLVVTLQILLSVYIAGLLFDVTALLTQSARWAALATTLYFLSGTTLWDNDILCDSLYASLFNIVILHLVITFLHHKTRSTNHLLALGAVWSCSILVRDNGLYFTIIPLLILLLRHRIAYRSLRKATMQCGVFALPVLLVVGTCAGWNAYRTGYAFISLTGVANYLHPAFDIERFGYADPFRGTTVLDRIVKSSMRHYDYAEQAGLMQNLHDTLGLTSPMQLQSIVLAKFISTIEDFPVAYTKYVTGNLNPIVMGDALFNPLFNYNQFFQLGAPPRQRIIPGLRWKEIRSLSATHGYASIALAAAAAILSTAACIAWLLTLASVPIIVFNQHRRQQPLIQEVVAAAILLATFVSVAGLYALVHLEARYLLVIIPEGLAAAAFVGRVFMARTRPGALPLDPAGVQRIRGAPQSPAT
jgi:hypothetical protein